LGALNALSQLGLILFLFLVGLKVRLHESPHVAGLLPSYPVNQREWQDCAERYRSRFSISSSHEGRKGLKHDGLFRGSREDRSKGGNNEVRIRKDAKDLGFAVMALVLASLGVNPLFSDVDIELAIPVLLGRMAFIVAATCFLVGRQVSRVAIVCPAPCDDLPVLLSMLRAMLTEYGYREPDNRQSTSLGVWGRAVCKRTTVSAGVAARPQGFDRSCRTGSPSRRGIFRSPPATRKTDRGNCRRALHRTAALD
jgi:hypothetical protein